MYLMIGSQLKNAYERRRSVNETTTSPVLVVDHISVPWRVNNVQSESYTVLSDDYECHSAFYKLMQMIVRAYHERRLESR